MDAFSFNPTNVFKDAATFSDPNNEAETREQLSLPHEQSRDYINNTIRPAIEALQVDVEALKIAVGDPESMQEVLAAIDEIKGFLAVTDSVAYVE